jgi:hypothetical protein
VLEDLTEPMENYAAGTAAPLVARKTTASFDKPAHVYDVRDGLYLGFTNKVTTFMTPGVAKVFSLLPYRLDELTLTSPRAARQGDVVPYRLTLHTSARPGNHVLHIAVIDPKGKKLRHYSRNVNCTRGRFDGKLHLALNESPGAYQIQIQDAATGLRAAATLDVAGREARQ